jgi:hypothetical protein
MIIHLLSAGKTNKKPETQTGQGAQVCLNHLENKKVAVKICRSVGAISSMSEAVVLVHNAHQRRAAERSW